MRLRQHRFRDQRSKADARLRPITLVRAITCGSEPYGVTCTDDSSGHFFRVSRESYHPAEPRILQDADGSIRDEMFSEGNLT
jgi:hypothetical protein